MKQNKPKSNAFEKRIHEIDLVRGFLILLVVMDHLFINFAMYSGPDKWNNPAMHGFFQYFYWQGIPRDIIQPLALMAFCFVSGISCVFSKNNWKRALLTLGVASLITAGSHVMQLFMDGLLIIDFNIITVLGVSMLCYCFIQKLGKKAIIAAILICFLMSSYLVPSIRDSLFNSFGGQAGLRPGCFYNVPYITVPPLWEPIYIMDGQPSFTADFVPLFPYMGFFFCGCLFSYKFYKDKKVSLFPNKHEWERPICFIGRHTFIIYIVHMLVISGAFALIDMVFRR